MYAEGHEYLLTAANLLKGDAMKILVAIANYGTKNVEYAKLLIKEFRSLPFAVDIVILSEAPKDYGEDVAVLVGLPSKDPWSLPFGHKKLFADNLDKYDVFIYTEDDILITEKNISAFLKASAQIGDPFLPGFVRYERHPDGKKNYPDVFGVHHWLPGTVARSGEYVFAKFSNEHSACFILTQPQLRSAIASGGFLVPPHSGRYDLICSAGNDPYTRCGFERVVCLSHLQEFELHHISNAYLNRLGVDEETYRLQIAALLEILERKRSKEELFPTQKPLPTPWWDRDYYEPCRDDVVNLIPADAGEILSVGCGWGATESHLMETGRRVVAIPLDSVIGKLAESKGIEVTVPNFGKVFDGFRDRQFDAIVLSEVVQHLPDPVDVFARLGTLLKENGVLVGSVPNLGLTRRLSRRLFARNRQTALLKGRYPETALNFTSAATVKTWLKASGLQLLEVRYENYATSHPLSRLAPYLPGVLTASNIVFSAVRTPPD
jgi:2-polyprenyl-3-methyl-5-hydroxy-6-metoxy-1,4-benzoquinol methylase